MTVVLSRLKDTYSKGVHERARAIELSETEEEAISNMFHEMTDNHLLERITRRWARRYNKEDEDILAATKELKRDATQYVRNPNKYKEQYKVAEQAFLQGKWVYMGQPVDWDKIPEEEVKRRQEAIAVIGKADAKKDEIRYVPYQGPENEMDDLIMAEIYAKRTPKRKLKTGFGRSQKKQIKGNDEEMQDFVEEEMHEFDREEMQEVEEEDDEIKDYSAVYKPESTGNRRAHSRTGSSEGSQGEWKPEPKAKRVKRQTTRQRKRQTKTKV